MMDKWKLFAITSHGVNVALAVSLMSQPDVTWLNPKRALEPTVKDGEGINRVHVNVGNPYPNLNRIAGLILLISGSHLILTAFGKETTKQALIEIGEDVKNIFTRYSETAVKTSQQIINASPVPFTLPDPDKATTAPDNCLTRFLQYPNCAVIGKSGSGKTVMMRQLLVEYLRVNPSAQVLLLDINLGKSGNDWLGLANKFGYSDIDQIYQAIEGVYQELQARKQRASHAIAEGFRTAPEEQPMLIIFDEFNSTCLMFQNNEKLYGDYKTKITEILLQCRAYNMKFVIGMQTPDSSSTKLSQAVLTGLSKCWLLYGQQMPSREMQYFPISDKDENDKPVINKLSDLVRRGKRACLLNIEGEKFAIATPDYSTQPRLAKAPLELWWDFTLENYQSQFMQMINSYLKKERLSPLEEIAKIAGCEVKKSDPKYSEYLGPWYQQTLVNLKNN